MIHLSAEKINLRAPYRVTQVDDAILGFTTKYGICYSAGFVHDVSIYENGVYQFFLINTSGKIGPKDDCIYDTIRVIIEEFFALDEVVMLYICDTTDGRQASRDRLFRAWFYTYVDSASFMMFSKTMTIDKVHYFSSILMRQNHPLQTEIINSFINFTEEHNQG